MHTYLIEMLECPACHAELVWSITEQNGDRIESAEAHCPACDVTYPVREGIGLFLTPELRRNDLWEQAESGLVQYLSEHPELQRQLMEGPLETLAPADQFFRALVLEEQGNYLEAQSVQESALRGLYTPEYRNCWKSQVDYVLEWLSGTEDPIVDLASGRGYLVEEVVRRLKRPVLATDLSPGVLRADSRRLKSLGLYDQVSLLAFDAWRTPFREGAVSTLTTNLGLPNIEEPGRLLQELRRTVAGALLAISHFYPEEDEANASALREAGLGGLLYQRAALEQFAATGWHVEVKNVCVGEAGTTPTGVLLDGARIDRFPVADTYLEWCVLLGNPGKAQEAC